MKDIVKTIVTVMAVVWFTLCCVGAGAFAADIYRRINEPKPSSNIADVLPKTDLPLNEAEEQIPTGSLRMVDRLERAIKHLVREAPRRPLFKNREMRIELANMVMEAAVAEGFDPFLILNIAFREGSFRADAEGGIHEKGTMQVHGIAKTYCEKKGLDLETIAGQLHCGSYYLRILSNECGGLVCALNGYASGKYSPAKSVVANSLKRLAEASELAHLSREFTP